MLKNLVYLSLCWVMLAHGETGLSPLVKYFTDRSKAVLLWIIYVISVLFLLCFRAGLVLCLVFTCWERDDPLALVCDV